MSLTDEKPNLDAIFSDLSGLSDEFNQLEESNRAYVRQLEGIDSSQGKQLKDLSHQRYRLGQLQDSLQSYKKAFPNSADDRVTELQKAIDNRKAQLADIGETLPRKSNIYLRTVLGNVNVSLLSKSERFKYKDEYERFKLKITIISTVMSFCNLFLFKYRFADAAFHFLLVWYYCTLTIREGILRMNGSRIQFWWVTHHYITSFVTGVLVTWPDSPIYQEFRSQFYVFSLYLGLVQILQYRYQHGQLYKMKALGEKGSMDVTVEGFHTWMWRGLGFLMPFLAGGYVFQLYNSYTLWKLSQDPRCHEWQVSVCALGFLILALGNIVTTLMVINSKIQRTSGGRKESARRELKTKYNEYASKNE